jgi:hypothetical protein
MDVVGLLEQLLFVVMFLLAIPLVWLWLRRRWLSRQGGAFECGLRRRVSTPGTGWVLGVARYRDESLQWFPAFGLSIRPRHTLVRGMVRAGTQRRPNAVEAVLLFDDQRVLELDAPEGDLELAMTPGSMTGLLSWLESAPPGLDYRR